MQNATNRFRQYISAFRPREVGTYNRRMTSPTRDAYWAGVVSLGRPEIWKAYQKLEEVNDFFAVKIAFERECVEDFLRGRAISGVFHKLINSSEAQQAMEVLYEKAINTVGVSDAIASDLGAHVNKTKKRLLTRAISDPKQELIEEMLFNGLLACFSFTPDYMSGSNNMRALLRKAYILESLLQLSREELLCRSLGYI